MTRHNVQVIDSNDRRLLTAATGLTALLLLASCANPVPADQAANGQVCEYVRVTGSNLPVKQCRSQDEVLAAAERDAAEQGLRDLQVLQEYEGKAPGGDSL